MNVQYKHMIDLTVAMGFQFAGTHFADRRFSELLGHAVGSEGRPALLDNFMYRNIKSCKKVPSNRSRSYGSACWHVSRSRKVAATCTRPLFSGKDDLAQEQIITYTLSNEQYGGGGGGGVSMGDKKKRKSS